MLNGILEQAQVCLGCAAPCSSAPSATNTGGGSYKAVIDLGVATGAVILTFTVNNIPDKMSWTYDGLTASEYSSPDFGYLQGVIGAISAAGSSTYCNSSTGNQIDNATGSNGGIYPNTSVFNYDAATNSFVATGATVTLGPYTNQAAGGVSFTSTKPGVVVMVVPKPNASPNLLEIDVDSFFDLSNLWFWADFDGMGVTGAAIGTLISSAWMMFHYSYYLKKQKI
jgi:hypothetical protein